MKDYVSLSLLSNLEMMVINIAWAAQEVPINQVFGILMSIATRLEAS